LPRHPVFCVAVRAAVRNPGEADGEAPVIEHTCGGNRLE
jgi:hypothetical protein